MRVVPSMRENYTKQPVDSEEGALIEKFSDASLGKYVSKAKKSNRSPCFREIIFVGMLSWQSSLL
jgi:hypothetical protein